MKTKAEEKSTIEVVYCMGSSCFSRGSNRGLALLQTYLEDNDLKDKIKLRGTLCQGQCQNGPNITVDGKVYHVSDPGAVLDIIKHHLDTQ